MAKYSIYCYTNSVNGKKYIGQSKDVSTRCNPSNYKGCVKFYRAIQKYGWEHFTREILEENLTLEEANEKEAYYISYYNSIEDGYNLKTGGLNCEYSQASKDKMSQSCKSKKAIIFFTVFSPPKKISSQAGRGNYLSRIFVDPYFIRNDNRIRICKKDINRIVIVCFIYVSQLIFRFIAAGIL